MANPPPRRFTVGDAMILVGASAAGLALSRSISSRPGSKGPSLEFDQFLFIGLLSAWTIALLLFRLRSPRPRLRRIALQPGFLATAAATASLAILALLVCLLKQRFRARGYGVDTRVITTLLIPQVGFAVGGAWLALILSGRRRPEPSWIDRMGRAIGALWLLGTVVVWIAALVP
jgi:hypothetical protein